MRLTLKELELLNTASAYNGEQHKAICGKATLELIEYKQIEEELGIDLITLFKALREGYWYRKGKKILFVGENTFVPYCHELIVNKKVKLLKDSCLKPCNYTFVYLRDYGITWALTKEELEKQE